MHMNMYINMCLQTSVYIDLYTYGIDFHSKVTDATFDEKEKNTYLESLAKSSEFHVLYWNRLSSL